MMLMVLLLMLLVGFGVFVISKRLREGGNSFVVKCYIRSCLTTDKPIVVIQVRGVFLA